jgi:hypothetical protein
VHLAAAHRVLRAQRFGPGMAAHFRLFALVSSARDTGAGRTEDRLLDRHLGFWRQAVPEATVSYRETGRYYTRLRLRLSAGGAEIGDGGFTTWTAQLTGNAKERCLISCVATERLAAVEA